MRRAIIRHSVLSLSAKDELLQNWEFALKKMELRRIAPLSYMWNDEIDVCPEYLYEKICKIPDNYIGIFYGWFYISN